MNTLKINTDYSSISNRVVAALIDAAILFIPCAIMGNIIPVIGGLAVAFFYAPILESSEMRATIGKHLMGIQVCAVDGSQITLKAALIRNIVKGISAMLLFIGFIAAFMTEKKQTVHDLLADTVVVYGRNTASMGQVWLENVRKLFQGGSDAPRQGSVISELERLKKLRDEGALTEDEFQDQKRKILNK